MDVSFKDQNVDIFSKIADASEFRLSQKTNPEEKQKITDAKFTCNFWRKISFKVREMTLRKGNSSAHLSRVFNLVYMRVGLKQFFCRKTNFVSFVLKKSLILQGEGNTDLLR